MRSKQFNQKSRQSTQTKEQFRPQLSTQGQKPTRSLVDNREPEIPRHWRVVAGDHAVKQILFNNKNWIKKVWLKNGWESSQFLRDVADEAKKKKLSLEVKSEAHLSKIYPNNQGCLVFADGRPRFDFEGFEKNQDRMIIALDGVEDPHNLGAILRTSWLTGVSVVLTPDDRSVGLSPTVHKVACGGVEHVPFEAKPQFHRTLENLKEDGFWIFGLSHKSNKTIFDIQIPSKVVWVLGAEDKGLRTTTEKVCDELVSLPQLDAAASYNVSVAAAMTLMETVRQHRN